MEENNIEYIFKKHVRVSMFWVLIYFAVSYNSFFRKKKTLQKTHDPQSGPYLQEANE
jgi:hypothetical protein